MKRITLLILTAAAAVFFAACSGMPDKPANNTNTNARPTNAAKPTAAAPTKEDLVALETKAFEAWKNKDGKFFEAFLTDNFVSFSPEGRADKAASIKGIVDSKCEVKSFSFSDEQMTPVGADVAILTLKAAEDYKCDGKQGESPAWSATVYVRGADRWQAAYHNEIPVMDPKAEKMPPPPPPDKAAPAKPAADVKAPDATTEALLAAVKKGWEAWKNRDAKALGDIITKDFVLIDPSGQRFDNAGAIKSWTEPKCDIKSFSLTDAAGISLSKDAGLITLKGSADGTCEGMGKIGTIWGTYVLVKEGDTWKAVMIFETPA